ncbi:MAG: hypothetical protein O4860_02975, partial [Trichodesmium sp. St2_bin2_1]|nr:hypothetical protein [Trichodesmium sp. St2_bin2_1]
IIVFVLYFSFQQEVAFHDLDLPDLEQQKTNFIVSSLGQLILIKLTLTPLTSASKPPTLGLTGDQPSRMSVRGETSLYSLFNIISSCRECG